MRAMTTRSSIKVKPRRWGLTVCLLGWQQDVEWSNRAVADLSRTVYNLAEVFTTKKRLQSPVFISEEGLLPQEVGPEPSQRPYPRHRVGCGRSVVVVRQQLAQPRLLKCL